MNSMYRNLMPRIEKKKEINVIGVGTKIVKTDMAIVVFDVVSVNKDPFKAISSNDQQIEAANTILKEFGIKEEDVFYARKELIPIYNENNEIVSYKMSTKYQIFFYDVHTLSELLYNIRVVEGTLVEIVFTLKDVGLFYDEAFDLAVSDAYDKAMKVAEKLGVKVDNIPQDLKEITDVDDLLKGIIYRPMEGRSEILEGFITLFATVEAKFVIL